MAKGLKVGNASQVDQQSDALDEVLGEDLAPSEQEEVAAAPVVQVAVVSPKMSVTERTVLVRPRVSRDTFRCSGKYWTPIAGREMRVPVGVAEHMERLGIT